MASCCPQADAEALIGALGVEPGFVVDLGHLTIVGRCAACQAASER